MNFRTKLILAGGVAFIALGVFIMRVHAQFVPGPAIYHMLTNSASGIPFCAVGGTAAPGPSTNLAGLACVLPFPIGSRGYAMQINCSGTNATTTTNMTITIEYSLNGVDYATNLTTTWIVGPLGVTYAPIATNNPQTDVTGVMGNYAAGRIRSIHHTNTGSIFITNLIITTR